MAGTDGGVTGVPGAADAAAARARAGSVSRALAASAVRLLEQDVDTGDPQSQRAVDDAIEAIAQRLTDLADRCHDQEADR
ncbi:MAG TPA: hypothetical protein VFJ12_11825 [Segeticoccus sp.]|jgi:hypothetical protein|nr:hypothetical protein [Segeticoccus sp.]